MRFVLIFTIFIFFQTAFAQGISEAEIRQFFDNYNSSPTKLLELMTDDFKFKDPTMKLAFNSKAELIKGLSVSSGVTKFKAQISSIYFISPFVVDVHGFNSGEMGGKPFRTLFSTILGFNQNKKLISWTDHVDPESFEGHSPVNKNNKRFIKNFFKVYEKLETENIDKFLNENIRLIDPTLGLNYKGIAKIKEVWKQSKQIFEKGKIRVKKMYFITENVVDIHGVMEAKTKKGNKLNAPFSTVLWLENGKIKHWVDHFDKESFARIN